ncbi:hypothetical protein Ancab_009807 [Ancistrocladus abbreviatus]
MGCQLVMYPYPGMGHLVSTVELGKLILTHHPSLSITILTTTFPFNSGSTASYISNVSSTTPSITFYRLPAVSLPQEPSSYLNMAHLTFEIVQLNNPHVDHALRSLSLSSTVSAFILDLFCSPAFPVAASLRIPTYYFFTSGASCLAFYLRFPVIYRSTTESFRHLQSTYFHVPGLSPIPAMAVPEPMLDRDSKVCKDFVEYTSLLPKADGIIVNTFPSLEPKPIQVFDEKVCSGDMRTPSIYCIGPLIASGNGNCAGVDEGRAHECLRWLDLQPSRSVVFLCFGSLGVFSMEQLKEIAVGLERSGQRFLWVIRNPPTEDKTKRFLRPSDPDLDLLLPEGFLDRTKDRGMVVKSWAPQVAVLSHESVGGFVTHCGWNSILEAVLAGVPMVAWPLYAEQRFNRIILVEEMKAALPMNKSENGFVSSEEVENRVRELIDSEEGDNVRKKALLMKDEARAALSSGGSSRVALAQLLESWKFTTC